jgi:hypothetical protein
MELSITREATSRAATREITSIIWSPKVHYCIHKSSPLVPILSQTKPINTLPHSISPRSILILSTHLRLGLRSGLFHSGSPTNNLYGLHFSLICATCPAHLMLLGLIILIILGKEYKWGNSLSCCFLHLPGISSLFGPVFLSSNYSVWWQHTDFLS